MIAHAEDGALGNQSKWMETDTVAVNDSQRDFQQDPVRVALWLAIVHTQATAKRMADAVRPPEVTGIDLTIDGYKVGSYVPTKKQSSGYYGALVEGTVSTVNCSTTHVKVLCGDEVLHSFRFEEGEKVDDDPYEAERLHSFRFMATKSCFVEAIGVNPFGEAMKVPFRTPSLRVLPPLSPGNLGFPDIDIHPLDDEAIIRLSQIWMSYREYGTNFDAAEQSHKQHVITRDMDEIFKSVRLSGDEWSRELRELNTSLSEIVSEGMQLMSSFPVDYSMLQMPTDFFSLRNPPGPYGLPDPLAFLDIEPDDD